MNARATENYLAISRSSGAPKGLGIFGARFIGGGFFFGPDPISIHPG
jgi:hypothetical protein